MLEHFIFTSFSLSIQLSLPPFSFMTHREQTTSPFLVLWEKIALLYIAAHPLHPLHCLCFTPPSSPQLNITLFLRAKNEMNLQAFNIIHSISPPSPHTSCCSEYISEVEEIFTLHWYILLLLDLACVYQHSCNNFGVLFPSQMGEESIRDRERNWPHHWYALMDIDLPASLLWVTMLRQIFQPVSAKEFC